MSARDSDFIEIDQEPQFNYGEKVISTKNIRNDGTYPNREIGDVLVKKGDYGYVASIGTFLQQFYIYGVDFAERGVLVGMKARELHSLDKENQYEDHPA
jgi:nitrogen fixation protein NifZ